MRGTRVVGVALLHTGPSGARVLAARRLDGPGTAGGWELPGGKCEGEESAAAAAVREVREELGCEVRVTGRLAGTQPIGDGLRLEVVLAELVAGEPVPHEHAAIRWLHADELYDVTWLAPDVPFLKQLEPLVRRREGQSG